MSVFDIDLKPGAASGFPNMLRAGDQPDSGIGTVYRCSDTLACSGSPSCGSTCTESTTSRVCAC